jgi:hypothetical protein
MTTTAWAHLPNARHIDAVLADVPSDTVWSECNVPWSVAVEAAEEMIKARELRDVRKEALLEIGRRASDMAWIAQAGAIRTLIAWDDSADLLECTPDVLRTMIDLAEPPVCHRAALLLPYATVRFGT